MRITILGSGSAFGVPMVFNTFGNASPNNPRNIRLRPSIFLEIDSKNILIDATPEFRLQINQNHITNIDSVLITHGHYDHIGGIPELPRASKILNHPISIYASKETLSELRQCYHYLFSSKSDAEPNLQNLIWNEIPNQGSFMVENLDFSTFQVPHHKLHPSAFKIKNFAYITDWEYISNDTLKNLYDLELLIIECNNGLIKEENGHGNLHQIKELCQQISPKQVVLTHLSTRVDYDELSHHLLGNIKLAYDGLVLEI
ncbi:MAG: MBL fold metallo-hydrolase [Alphaproteobacteria bacterium]|nr:MBL fold metallo-hydrolase [Alphaproteobacteria bacterium]